MILIPLLLALHSPAPALAASGCNNLRIQNMSATTVDFTSNTAPTVSFEVRRAGNNGCSFYVACSNNNGAESGAYTARTLNQGANTIPVQLCLDGACNVHCKRRGEASGTEVFTGTFPDGDNNPTKVTFSLYPRLGTLDYPRFGSYQQTFELRVYNGAFNSSDEDDHETLSLQYSVAKSISLSLVDTGGAYNASSVSKTLDFGTFSTSSSVQRTADLVLKFNAGYRVLMKSDGAGTLRKGGTGPANIPYTLTLDGNSVSLTTTLTQVTSGSGVNPAGGKRLPIVATVAAIPVGQASGAYSDSITVQVQTTE